jgi:hypothetical protein
MSALQERLFAASLKTLHTFRWMNRLGGELVASIAYDILPGLLCAGHFVVLSKDLAPGSPEALLRAGASMQRQWLTATQRGRALQPEYAAVTFADYARSHTEFTREARLVPSAQRVRKAVAGLIGQDDIGAVVFMARIGTPQSAPLASRSLRLPLAELVTEPEANRPRRDVMLQRRHG